VERSILAAQEAVIDSDAPNVLLDRRASLDVDSDACDLVPAQLGLLVEWKQVDRDHRRLVDLGALHGTVHDDPATPGRVLPLGARRRVRPTARPSHGADELAAGEDGDYDRRGEQKT
jgi:hypothetical protein